MFGVDAIEDFYRSALYVVDAYRPQGEDWDSRQAAERATEAIKALPVPPGAEQARRNIVEGLPYLLNDPLHPERQVDLYGWLRATLSDWEHNHLTGAMGVLPAPRR